MAIPNNSNSYGKADGKLNGVAQQSTGPAASRQRVKAKLGIYRGKKRGTSTGYMTALS